MDMQTFAQVNPELFMQVLRLGERLEYFGYVAHTPEQAFKQDIQITVQLAAEQAAYEIEMRAQDDSSELSAGCPHCGSYEGDWQECPECGHGQ